MAYAQYIATYDPTLRNSVVTITEKYTGRPATILERLDGGIASNQGLAKLDAQARLSVIIDTDKEWVIKVVDGQVLPYNVYPPKQVVTAEELRSIVPKVGVTYVLDVPPYTEYKWDGHQFVSDLTSKQVNSLKSLSDSSISNMQFNQAGKLISYISQGVPHTVSYPDPTTIVFSNNTGVLKTIKLDGNGHVLTIT